MSDLQLLCIVFFAIGGLVVVELVRIRAALERMAQGGGNG